MIAVGLTDRERDLLLVALDGAVSEGFVAAAEGDALHGLLEAAEPGDPLDLARAFLNHKDAAFDENALGHWRFREHVMGRPDPVAGVRDDQNPFYKEADDA